MYKYCIRPLLPMGLDWSVFSWIQSYIIYTYRTAVASSYVEHVGVFILLYICTVPVPHERQAITQSPVHNRYTLNTTVLEKLRSYTLILFIHDIHTCEHECIPPRLLNQYMTCMSHMFANIPTILHDQMLNFSGILSPIAIYQ